MRNRTMTDSSSVIIIYGLLENEQVRRGSDRQIPFFTINSDTFNSL